VKILSGMIVVGLLMLGSGAFAATPVVSNVVATARTDGSGLVDVTYDVADADNDTLTVALVASADDGQSWSLPCRTTSGDVGPSISPGPDKLATWNFGSDNGGLSFDTCRIRVIASDRGVAWHAQTPVRPAVLEWRDLDWSDERILEELAQAEILCLSAHYFWGDQEAESLVVLDRIRAINPDCKIIGYVLAKTTFLAWENANPVTEPFQFDWYQRTRPYWSYTTLGDTLFDWPGQAVLNILEPECREAIASTITQYQNSSPNKFDGVFWDYFNNGIWVPDFVSVEGEVDLDGDGIAQSNDPDERAAYKLSCELLVQAVRDSLGEDFLQCFNGQRAYADSAFSSMADIISYEGFPIIFYQQLGGMRRALDPAEPFSIIHTRLWPRTVNGGPWTIIENIQQNIYFDEDLIARELPTGRQLRVVALLFDGILPVWDSSGNHHYDWPENPVSLGHPLGETVIEGNDYSRDFEFGRVEMTMTSGSMPNPFNYTIWCNGVVIESMALPSVFPPPLD